MDLPVVASAVKAGNWIGRSLPGRAHRSPSPGEGAPREPAKPLFRHETAAAGSEAGERRMPKHTKQPSRKGIGPDPMEMRLTAADEATIKKLRSKLRRSKV